MDGPFSDFILWINSFTWRPLDEIIEEYSNEKEIIEEMIKYGHKCSLTPKITEFCRLNPKKMMMVSGYLKWKEENK